MHKAFERLHRGLASGEVEVTATSNQESLLVWASSHARMIV